MVQFHAEKFYFRHKTLPFCRVIQLIKLFSIIRFLIGYKQHHQGKRRHYTASYFLACQHKLITYHYELFLMKNLRRKWIRKLDILHEVIEKFAHAKSYVPVDPSPLGLLQRKKVNFYNSQEILP
jgi:hypothetical protein